VQFHQGWCYIVRTLEIEDRSCRCIDDGLQTTELVVRQVGQHCVVVVQPTKQQWHNQWFAGGQWHAPTYCPQLLQQNTTPLFSVPVCVWINRHQCIYPSHELLTQDLPGEVQHEAGCTVTDFDNVQWHTKVAPSCWCWAATDLIVASRGNIIQTDWHIRLQRSKNKFKRWVATS